MRNPEGSPVYRPPATGTAHTLPYHQLSPRDFERLCLWLVQREGFDQAEHLGAAGKEQGRDITAQREGQLWAFQCKRVRNFYPADAETEVDKVLGLPDDLRPAALVFLVACDVSDETRNRARARCADKMDCHFWALTEIDERVKRHPHIVEEFFQIAERSIIQRILGTGPDERRALRNRRAMLSLVRSFWIEGVLEQSLHDAAMIELGMEEKLDAVEQLWDMVLQTDREDRVLPPGTKIIDVFDEMGENLLILGEPGSGKTTMLLELARDTIARAEQDPTQAIPVVFNLSSWADERQPIAEWLVAELNTKYNIPEKITRQWVDSDELLPLLDGLDEVAPKYRDDCVKAINEFRQEHLVPLVVCSRVADYEVLTARLRLQGAVLLQSLTPQQIDDYLGGVGEALSPLRETLQDDPTLQELAETPLMLSIMTLAYQGMSAEDLRVLDTVEARRQHLFDTYVQRMFERRGVAQPCPPKRTIHWLGWLAREMKRRAQTMFMIEQMQPGWLQEDVERTLYASIIIWILRLVFFSSLGLVISRLTTEQFCWLPGILLPVTVFGWCHSRKLGHAEIQPVEKLNWSWKNGWTGLICGLVAGKISLWIFGLAAGPTVGRIVSLVFVLTFWLTAGMSYAEIGTRTVPNQGIQQSARNAGITWLIAGLTSGLIIGLVGGLISGLIAGMIVGLTFSLIFGGFACIQHFTLRFILQRHGYLPWNLVPFLDYAAERIFLRKVGGGYIFIHRLLQDYFASLYQDQ